jgi:aquaporin rerated protein, invertebrate
MHSICSGAFTGGSLNPARSLGPAIFANQWENHFVYWIGPLVGAIVAGFLYRFVDQSMSIDDGHVFF